MVKHSVTWYAFYFFTSNIRHIFSNKGGGPINSLLTGPKISIEVRK